jgi:hypothetical protein
MREHEKELEMVADEWRDEVGEARAQVEELKDVSRLCLSQCIFENLEEQWRNNLGYQGMERTGEKGGERNAETDNRYSRTASKTSKNSAKPSLTARKNWQ